jgi:DNA invertase Pin-like site-specific DNA recombinase
MSLAKQVSSVAVQKSLIEAYCKKEGLTWRGRFYVDPATSGKTAVMDRPAGREMMQNLKRGDHVIVAHLDRMFRSFVNFAVTMEVFEQRGITVHILDMHANEAHRARRPHGSHVPGAAGGVR